MGYCAKGGEFKSIPCKIVCTKEIDVYPLYRPIVGKIYDAIFSPGWTKGERGKNGVPQYSGKGDFCVVDILDKKIILRKGEYEFVEVANG